MDFSFSEEEELFRKAVREFCTKNIAPRIMEIEEKAKIPESLFKSMAQLGLFGLNVSSEYGGLETSFINTAIAAEEIGYADISLSIAIFPFLIENSFAYIVDKYGTKQLKEEILPKITKGEILLGIAATEPHCGNDLAAMKTKARMEDNHYLITGEKAYVTGVAEIKERGGGFLTLTYTAPERRYRGITLLYVPLNLPGIETTLYGAVGKRGSSYGGFTLADVKVPKYFLVGEEGRGVYLALEGISKARVLMSMAAIGAARRCFELAMDYAKQRIVFGKPVASYQGIQFQLADDYMKLEAAKLLTYKAAWLIDKEVKREVPTAVAMTKLWVPHVAYDAINHVLLWYGAYGYTKECPIEIGLRGVLSLLSGAGGTDNAMRLIISRGLLGKEFMS
ncbi:MAG: acyl-CoA dehydrogenase family protein [Candidatus Bathyarchaeia archaeon]